jgi:hypothetical protein
VKYRVLRCCRIEMERLRVKFGGKALDPLLLDP